MTVNRTNVVLGICFFALLATSAHAADKQPPNILFILADDVGCEPLGCYGGTSHETPNLDRLADSGMKFHHCYSMPVCHPTRICILTGRYPRHVGHPRWGSFPKELEGKTIAHVMKDAGYATAVAGKWQIAMLGKDLDHPYRLGFDEYCLFGWHEGPRYHDPLIWQNGRQRTGTTGQYGPHLYVDFLIDFMAKNRNKPFFAFYSMALCHDVTDDLKAPVPYAPGKDRYLSYAEMIVSMDDCVGRIVDGLERLKLRKRTIIIFTGDNGTAAGSIVRAEPADGKKKWKYIRDEVYSTVGGQQIRGGKGKLTNTGTNVPLIINQPGTIRGGQIADDLVDFSDFLPTFANIAGGTVPDEVKTDGVSFQPRLSGVNAKAREWAYSESKNRFWVRTQRWKLYNDGGYFDIANDPAEKKNLAGQPLTDDAKQIRERLQKVVESL